MNTTVINAFYRYFEALYNLNRNLITLCGTNSFDHMEKQHRYMDEVITTIPRLIPYKLKRNTNEIELISTDGLMRFLTDIPFLNADYKKLLQDHNGFLVKAKKIRNKLEHELDNAQITSSCGGSSTMFSVTYRVGKNSFTLRAEELILFVKDLNALFSKIQENVYPFAVQNEQQTHPYIRRLTRYDFSDFNKIYESDLLYVFGKTMLPF
jgi:hypothetical protein